MEDKNIDRLHDKALQTHSIITNLLLVQAPPVLQVVVAATRTTVVAKTPTFRVLVPLITVTVFLVLRQVKPTRVQLVLVLLAVQQVPAQALALPSASSLPTSQPYL
jgi:hypothetical protein